MNWWAILQTEPHKDYCRKLSSGNGICFQSALNIRRPRRECAEWGCRVPWLDFRAHACAFIGVFSNGLLAMAEKGDDWTPGDQQSADPGEDDRSWVRVIQGAPRGAAWTSYKIFNKVIDQFQAFFFKVLKLSKALIEDSRQQWKGLTVLVWSLDRVLAEWISKEVRLKAKIDFDSEIFFIEDDHFILGFKAKRECSSIIHYPWWSVVCGRVALSYRRMGAWLRSQP